jgi:hypothetical protein
VRDDVVAVAHTDPEEQTALGVLAVGGGLGPAVAEVARRARLGVEQRAQPVAAVGRGRGDDPVVVEEVVADREEAAAVAVEAGDGLGEGLGPGVLDGGVAPRGGPLLVGQRRRGLGEVAVVGTRLAAPVVVARAGDDEEDGDQGDAQATESRTVRQIARLIS